MEELETLESSECPECPGPPPEFRLPPPPRPPFLTEGTFCSETPLAELEDCVAIPMIDASHHTNPSLQSTALIVTCAVVLLLMAAIVSVVFWKHKRKVQNLLPCKSATGSATASAVAAAGRGRVLPSDGPHRPGSGGGAAGTILYEDLPDAVAHHHLAGQAATIEVRGRNDDQRLWEQQPAPHHLDYLDYRDPRAILRVQNKPSRAVLGGYRTPRALLAKSQEVPLSIATYATCSRGDATSGVTSPLLAANNLDTRFLSEARFTLEPNLVPADRSADPEDRHFGLKSADPILGEIETFLKNDSTSLRVPITPTHRPSRLNHSSPLRSTGSIAPVVPSTESQPSLPTTTVPKPSRVRRPSVDSEGYSYIDFRESDSLQVDASRRPPLSSQRVPRLQGTWNSSPCPKSNSRSNSIDSDGYSYIMESGYRKPPGAAKRIVSDATEEEVCPLCTMRQIHHLLATPDVYLNVPET